MRKILVWVSGILLLAATQANATILDLTADSSSGQINNAWFIQNGVQPAGTGVIKPFLRIQNNVSEVGYNADGSGVMPDVKTGAWTHSLLLSAIPTVTFNGTVYREFLLDINQTSANPLLSLDQLKIYLTSNSLNGSEGALTPLTPVYNMDAGVDSWIKLNYDLESGSGVSDMFAYIPDSVFSGGPYVTLYSQFGAQGGDWKSNDGFEEWAARTPSTPVPEPATMLLFGTGLVGLAGMARRKK